MPSMFANKQYIELMVNLADIWLSRQEQSYLSAYFEHAVTLRLFCRIFWTVFVIGLLQ